MLLNRWMWGNWANEEYLQLALPWQRDDPVTFFERLAVLSPSLIPVSARLKASKGKGWVRMKAVAAMGTTAWAYLSKSHDTTEASRRLSFAFSVAGKLVGWTPSKLTDSMRIRGR